jgi:ribonuclease HII
MLLPFLHPNLLEAGCDEAGRGCLAGPVFAAAVILPTYFSHPLLRDSKKCSVEQRNHLRDVVEHNALAWCVAMVSEAEIDRINILQASIKAMHEAVRTLEIKPDWLLIDGNQFKPFLGIGHTCIVKGDSRFAAIAAASILAKTHRDEYMEGLHDAFPHYHWRQNKGYPTATHREAIKQYGRCKHHRMSFVGRSG